MSERRYNDDEVAEILARATAEDPPAVDRANALEAGHGLTLPALEAIALEVGVAPERVAQAARTLDRRNVEHAQERLLGQPRSVSRMVPLDAPLDDGEWDRLVAELRATFGAVGEVSSHGGLRTWRNGNLQVHVEPEGESWRLRMRTRKGDAGQLAGLGAGAIGMGGLLAVVSATGGMDTPDMVIAAGFLAGGTGYLVYLRGRLGRWAAERSEQMQRIAERVRGLLTSV